MKKLRELQEWKTSLIISLSCMVLVLVAYIIFPSQAGAVPDFWQGACSVFNVLLGIGIVYVIYNDGVDNWPVWLVFLLALAVLGLQAGYKCDAYWNVFPSQPTAYVPEYFRGA